MKQIVTFLIAGLMVVSSAFASEEEKDRTLDSDTGSAISSGTEQEYTEVEPVSEVEEEPASVDYSKEQQNNGLDFSGDDE